MGPSNWGGKRPGGRICVYGRQACFFFPFTTPRSRRWGPLHKKYIAALIERPYSCTDKLATFRRCCGSGVYSEGLCYSCSSYSHP